MSNKEALADAMKIVRKAAPGRYTLKQLYGDEWQWVYRPRYYGRWFRAAVRRDDLPGVRWVRKRSDKSHEYEVLPRPIGQSA